MFFIVVVFQKYYQNAFIPSQNIKLACLGLTL